MQVVQVFACLTTFCLTIFYSLLAKCFPFTPTAGPSQLSKILQLDISGYTHIC